MTPPDDFTRAVEAVLFAAEAPLTIEAIRAHVGTGDVQSQPHGAHGHPHSVQVNIPPLSTVFFEWVSS